MKKKAEKEGKTKKKVSGKKEKKSEKVEVKELKEEKNLEDEISENEEEISDSNFNNFLNLGVSRRTVPVLDRIAVAQNTDLEEQLAEVTKQRNEEENQIKYGTDRIDYGTTHEHRTDVVKYEAEGPKYGAFGEKKDEEKNRFTGTGIRSEWKEDEREKRWQMEGQKEAEDQEKKYLSKGKY